MSSAPPTLPEEGSTLAGRYLLGRVLGKGAMGVVYDAHQTRLESRVAIKVLRPEILTEPGLVARFEREARIIAKLNSRHIVRVLDVDATETGLPFLVMEFLDGWDLASELRSRGPFTVERALEVISELCSGVDDAHRAGVVHRDLKPSNIFLVANNELGAMRGSRSLKIVDFGVSKLVGSDTDMTATASTLGTPRYMSPEQIRSSKNVDGRSDVWAIGTIFFELLTGRTPFQGESATGVAAAIVTEDPYPLRQLRPDVPEWVDQLILGALIKNPDRRIATAAAFRAALDQGIAWSKQNRPVAQVHDAAPQQGPPPQSAPQHAPAQQSPPQQMAHEAAAPMVPPWQQPSMQAQVATQSSWASAEPGTSRASKAPLIAIFVGVFVLFGGGLGLFLFLGMNPHRPTPADASKNASSTSEPATPAPTLTAQTTPSSTPTGIVSASAIAATETPSANAGSKAPATAAPTATPPPPQATPHEATPPPPPPTKDCPASRKILVGGKLTCP